MAKKDRTPTKQDTIRKNRERRVYAIGMLRERGIHEVDGRPVNDCRTIALEEPFLYAFGEELDTMFGIMQIEVVGAKVIRPSIETPVKKKAPKKKKRSRAYAKAMKNKRKRREILGYL